MTIFGCPRMLPCYVIRVAPFGRKETACAPSGRANTFMTTPTTSTAAITSRDRRICGCRSRALAHEGAEAYRGAIQDGTWKNYELFVNERLGEVWTGEGAGSVGAAVAAHDLFFG